ncbi:MAG: PIN domain-containing protein [Chloroflexi bacterium]|nr:PIN domain-containing protein [Chloroflexota bacterium]
MNIGERDAIFVDSGPWIGLIDPRDQWREAAVKEMERLMQARRPLVTTNLVLLEAYTGLVGRVRRSAIARLRSLVLDSTLIYVHRVTELDEALAWRKFVQYDDKLWSMVDCTSFVVMEQLLLTTAFTFDHHFRQAGFQTLPTNLS